MRNSHFFIPAALLATLLLIGGIMLVQKELNRTIRDAKLIPESYAADGGAPPAVALTTVALGGFRGLVADYLWLRAVRLQDEGKYFELVQLADWIQLLQPKNTAAAQFLAWNMAYNLSVTQRDFSARWRWIHKGLDHLGKAIEMNPNDPMLYRDLAWIYMHKLGDQMDDAQIYYKYRLAGELYDAFGQRHAPDWEALARADAWGKQLSPRSPAGRILAQSGYGDPEVLLKKFIEDHGVLPAPLASALGEKTAGEVSAYLRAQWIRKLVNIEPRYALEMEKKYGNFDWLLPETFAIYWAERGIAKSGGHNTVECSRVISQGLKTAFFSGRILFLRTPQSGERAPDSPTENFMILPNASLADAAISQYRREADADPGHFRTGFLNFMAASVERLYLFDDREAADKIYRELRDERRYGEARGKTLEQFVRAKFQRSLEACSMREVETFLYLFLRQSALDLANGNREKSALQLDLARQVYEMYVKRFFDEKTRLGMPPFDTMKKIVVEQLMQDYPGLAPALRFELDQQKTP